MNSRTTAIAGFVSRVIDGTACARCARKLGFHMRPSVKVNPKRCDNPAHMHSALVSLHAVEHEAVAAGLIAPIDARNAQGCANAFTSKHRLPTVQVIIGGCGRNYGMYTPRTASRPMARIILNERTGSYKTLAHEMAHHLVALNERKGTPIHGKAFRRWFSFAIREIAQIWGLG